MKLSLLVLLTFFMNGSVYSQTVPKLDPDKYTVCSMTLNSSEERKIFEDQMKKNPSKFNPIVELTSFGDKDWFSKACATGIKCDQVLVSGHFASTFSGTSGKKLPLKTMEKAGCSNTCDGILDHPYEVFLFACNAMATKALDRRTPESYLETLLKDGYERSGAEFAVEERYGKSGDDNKTRIERAFRGRRKQVYGFDSVGPSGKSVDRLLKDYFSKTSLLEGLEKAEAARAMKLVDSANEMLADSMDITDFAQCTAGRDDEKDRRICKLLHDQISVTDKLDVLTDAFTQEDWIKYVPTMNTFLKANPPSTYTKDQRETFNELMRNKVLKGQVKNMVKDTKSLVVQMEWIKFAKNFNYITEAEEAQYLSTTLNRMLAKGLTASDAKLICSKKLLLKSNFTRDENKTFPQSAQTDQGLECLRRSQLTRESLGLDKL